MTCAVVSECPAQQAPPSPSLRRHPLGTMSAQAVLSMIAPAASATSQGSPSAEDASSFRDALAAQWVAEAPSPGAAGAIPTARPSRATVETIDTASTDLDIAEPGTEDIAEPGAGGAGLAALPPTSAPPPSHGLIVRPASTEAHTPAIAPNGELPAGETVAQSTAVNEIGRIFAADGHDVGRTSTAGGRGSDPTDDDVQTTSPLPFEKSTNVKEQQPQVLPGPAPDEILPVKPMIRLRPSTGGVAPSAFQEQSAALTAANKGSPPPQPQTVPVGPVTPPMRELAERTSKPLAGSGTPAISATPADTDLTADPRPATASATPVPAPVAAALTRSPEPAATVRPDPNSPLAPLEAAPGGEEPVSKTETVSQSRDHNPSALSRATLDATAQIAVQIQRKLEGRSTRFEIALRPDELGRVDVKLDIDAEGRLAARLAFDNPAAATDLRGRADELRRQLEDAGFHLAEDAFEFADRDSGSSAFDRGQDARDGRTRAFSVASKLNAEIDLAQPPQWLARSLSPAGVDMKV